MNHPQDTDKVKEVVSVDVCYNKDGFIKYDLVYLEYEGEYTKEYNAQVINGTDIIKQDN